VPGVTVHDLGERKCGIVTFSKADADPGGIAADLLRRRMNVSISSVEYARLDLGHRGTGPLVRASVHYFNTEDEIDRFVAAVAEC
jgi:selenocysteine lyase/cysteine desulfurase